MTTSTLSDADLTTLPRVRGSNFAYPPGEFFPPSGVPAWNAGDLGILERSSPSGSSSGSGPVAVRSPFGEVVAWGESFNGRAWLQPVPWYGELGAFALAARTGLPVLVLRTGLPVLAFRTEAIEARATEADRHAAGGPARWAAGRARAQARVAVVRGMRG